MKKYLITGAGGFLGSLFTKKISAYGNQVTGLGKKKQVIAVDISLPFSFDKKYHFDIVIHAAGKAHVVPNSPEEEREFYQVNLEGTKNLCAAIEQLPNKPKAFIFISSVSVYGKDSGEMIQENSPLSGMSPYAKSKILAEEWLQQWAVQHDIRLSILRLPLIVGANPPGNLGAMIQGIKTGRYLSIGKAESKKSMVWAEDVADLIPHLSKTEGIFNLTDGYHPSFGELENAICTAIGKKNPFKLPIYLARILGKVGDLLGDRFPVNSQKIDKITSTLTFDDQKARKQLNWKPTPVLEKVIEIV